jgi:predicted nucleic acid-binding protein
MAALSVRGLSEAQLAYLKQEARRQGISVNRLVLQRLAGTWTQADADAFAAAIAPLEQVDSDLWIAASCVEYGAVLFSLDAHFDQVAGLRRITRWAEALP